MQNKGLIKFLAWAFALVCLFQLSFTVVTNVIQGRAKSEAKNYINSEQVQKQIAARASQHLKVYKEQTADRTVSRIRELSAAERIIEVAVMLSSDPPTHAALQTAKELMQ